MEKIDLMVKAPHFYTMAGQGLGYLADGAMAVDSGKIKAIGPSTQILKAYQSEQILERPCHLVLPGFIDAHMHMVDALMRGLAQDTDHWMMHGISPFQMEMDQHGQALGVELAVAEAMASGTTCFGEFSDYNPDILKFMEKAGVRCQMTLRIREAQERIYEPGEIYTFDPAQAEKDLENSLDAFDRWQGSGQGRISILLGPQGPDFVSKKMLIKIKEKALERNTKIHMHVQQGDRETYQTLKRYNLRPIAFLDEIGYLDRHLIAVHLTDARADEAVLAASQGVSMILCSGSIGIIDGIVPPAKAFCDAGGKVALGSDQAPGNNCHNMFNEMKLTALFNKIKFQDPKVMPASQVLKMATIDGAKALGLDREIGSLEPGKQADFILVNLSTPTMAPVYTQPMRNLVPNLVYSARGHEVSTLAVNGKILYDKGCYLTLDLPHTLGRANQYAAGLGSRGTKNFKKINGANAQMMKHNLL